MDIIDLDKVALEIARKHLLEKVSFRELGRMYYASPSTIHRRLTNWLAENRFELQDKLALKKTTVTVAREDSLGEELTRKTGIWRARVVQISGVEEAYSEYTLENLDNDGVQATYRASDELHRCLGGVAAELILGDLRRNMTIGISSGRGVGFAIDGCKEIVSKTPSWASGYESIRLVSLCGGAHLGKYQNSSVRDFDADENVFALSSLLKSPRHNVFYMTGPVLTDLKNHRSKINPKLNLDLAIIGLGQLNAQHGYFRDHLYLQLETLSEPIRKIIEWQTKAPDLLDSVAEIVLRLYPATDKKLPTEFLDTIREMNNHVLAVAPEKIKDAGEVILIAGGRQKVNVLHGVLTGVYSSAPIDKRNLTLVTDSWTAQEILKRQ